VDSCVRHQISLFHASERLDWDQGVGSTSGPDGLLNEVSLTHKRGVALLAFYQKANAFQSEKKGRSQPGLFESSCPHKNKLGGRNGLESSRS
jgi:hypothetical protein